jgi:predicted dehydrogenase
MINVGLVGIGFMGWTHWLAYQQVPGIRVTAIGSQSPKKRSGDWRGVQGNFGPPGEKVDLAGIKAYGKLDELLDDPQIDLVDITLPPALHTDVAVRALKAGKHVFCEKPLALTTADCQRIIRAAERADRMLMVGQVLPFFPEYVWALKSIKSGKYGKLRGGSFRRVISDPSWLKNYWSAKHVGGPMLDLHVHDTHFIRLACGQPTAVTTRGRMRNGLAEFWHSFLEFKDRNLLVETTAGTIGQQGRVFEHGFEIHLEQATLMFNFTVLGGEGKYLCPPTLLNNRGKVIEPKLAGGDPLESFQAEIREVVKGIKTGRVSEVLDARLARDAIVLCQKQTESIEKNRRVTIRH